MNGSYVKRMKSRRYSIDLCAHMAECDANYLRLVKLMPSMATSDERVVGMGHGADGHRVSFRVLERSRYTCVVEIHELGRSRDNGGEAADGGIDAMKIRVRLYHDARSAEVIEIQRQRRFEPVYDYPNPQMRARDEKAQVNKYLGEFLANCLSHGVSHEAPIRLSGEVLIG